ncbi:MAG: DUF6431 domain-containing protein [Desulfitobacteriaceae bacterium]|nr:DUF6431 domain-containing protein [Desulfitobacteriaceae bacterium]MDD4347307.1 DUF6431 domain-containing protein [Desulfitobacteriaceae bacterium]MDD4402750.1 DUF6431 domain-containing protein [Desulfitobacteriaceae bacterium]
MQIEIYCNTCGSQMVYHACYKVQYKSNTLQTEIVVLRYKCRNCNVTHAIKPEFLASRHQYDTFERQAFVLQYTYPSKAECSLRKLQNKLFPQVPVSHTVMYYWVRVVEVKKQKVEPLLLADLQQMVPPKDLVDDLAKEAQTVPSNVRDKEYSRKTVTLLQWTKLYTRALNAWVASPAADIATWPYRYLNRILDLLKSHIFL